MKNAHTRIGSIEYMGGTSEKPTRVQAWFDRFAKEKDGDTLMLSIFGNDAEVAGFQGALISRTPMMATTPDGKQFSIDMGDKVATFKGHIQIPGRPRPIRHLVAFSQALTQNGMDGRVFLFNRRPDIAWATIISFLGLPATPDWAEKGMKWLEDSEKLSQLESYGCSASVVMVSRDELLRWIGDGIRSGELNFPQQSGPVIWPQYKLRDLFSDSEQSDTSEIGLATAA